MQDNFTFRVYTEDTVYIHFIHENLTRQKERENEIVRERGRERYREKAKWEMIIFVRYDICNVNTYLYLHCTLKTFKLFVRSIYTYILFAME